MSVFDNLLEIKRFRENQAELALARERQLHIAAEKAQEAAQDLLLRFRKKAESAERDMYNDLCARIVKLREIEEVLHQVAELRLGEKRHEEAVQAAKEKVQAALQALAASREMHQLASRVTQKFVDIAQWHMEEYLKTMEQKEDLEMEEAASFTRSRNDWEQFEGNEE